MPHEPPRRELVAGCNSRNRAPLSYNCRWLSQATWFSPGVGGSCAPFLTNFMSHFCCHKSWPQQRMLIFVCHTNYRESSMYPQLSHQLNRRQYTQFHIKYIGNSTPKCHINHVGNSTPPGQMRYFQMVFTEKLKVFA